MLGVSSRRAHDSTLSTLSLFIPVIYNIGLPCLYLGYQHSNTNNVLTTELDPHKAAISSIVFFLGCLANMKQSSMMT